MTIVYSDIKNGINNYIKDNCLLQSILGNSFFISLLITLLLIIIFNVNSENQASQILYSFMTVFFITLLYGKILKATYNVKTGASNKFFTEITGAYNDKIKNGEGFLIKPQNDISGSNLTKLNTKANESNIICGGDIKNFLNL